MRIKICELCNDKEDVIDMFEDVGAYVERNLFTTDIETLIDFLIIGAYESAIAIAAGGYVVTLNRNDFRDITIF